MSIWRSKSNTKIEFLAKVKYSYKTKNTPKCSYTNSTIVVRLNFWYLISFFRKWDLSVEKSSIFGKMAISRTSIIIHEKTKHNIKNSIAQLLGVNITVRMMGPFLFFKIPLVWEVWLCMDFFFVTFSQKFWLNGQY